MGTANMSREELESRLNAAMLRIKTIKRERKRLSQQNAELRTLVRFYRERYPDAEFKSQ